MLEIGKETGHRAARAPSLIRLQIALYFGSTTPTQLNLQISAKLRDHSLCARPPCGYLLGTGRK